MKVHDLQPAEGSRKRAKRVGRGIGGKGGKTAGRGTKGQSARRSIRVGFEGGQLPLQQRLPNNSSSNNIVHNRTITTIKTETDILINEIKTNAVAVVEAADRAVAVDRTVIVAISETEMTGITTIIIHTTPVACAMTATQAISIPQTTMKLISARSI